MSQQESTGQDIDAQWRKRVSLALLVVGSGVVLCTVGAVAWLVSG